MQVFAET